MTELLDDISGGKPIDVLKRGERSVGLGPVVRIAVVPVAEICDGVLVVDPVARRLRQESRLPSARMEQEKV